MGKIGSKGVFAFAVLVASSAVAAEKTSYTGYIPRGMPAQREFPIEEALSDDEMSCYQAYKAKSFVFYTFETDALKKEQRFGKQALDQHDIAWITAVENRKEACMALLYRTRSLGWWDTLVYWWNK
jgi:hypothetical protein